MRALDNPPPGTVHVPAEEAVVLLGLATNLDDCLKLLRRQLRYEGVTAASVDSLCGAYIDLARMLELQLWPSEGCDTDQIALHCKVQMLVRIGRLLAQFEAEGG
jgi:hypothetical protein